MKTFEIEYHDEVIRVSVEDNYKLSYPDGRWLILKKRSDDTGVVSSFNDNTSYSTASVWAVESKSEGPDWVNREQLQVIGELVVRKELELENGVPSARA
jgi:hypothetical protein